jgi:hypothetical protein
LNAVCRRRLRDPLFPASPTTAKTAPAVAAKPVVALQVKLLGTMLEADGAYAMFSTGVAGVQVRKVGQRVGDPKHGPEVVRIDAREAVIRVGGQDVALSVEGRKMN